MPQLLAPQDDGIEAAAFDALVQGLAHYATRAPQPLRHARALHYMYLCYDSIDCMTFLAVFTIE